MAPEFNFLIDMTLDLPSKSAADHMASSLEHVLMGVNEIVVSPSSEPTDFIPELRSEDFSGMNFGQIFKFLRNNEGLSQREVSRRAKIDPTTLSRMESDSTKHHIRSSTLVSLIRSFGWKKGDPRIELLLKSAGRDDHMPYLAVIGKTE